MTGVDDQQPSASTSPTANSNQPPTSVASSQTSSTSTPFIDAATTPSQIAGSTSTTPSFELVSCKVCNQPTVNRIRCGVLACEACKKFFQRNRDQVEALRCVTGTFNCSLSDDRAALTSSGTVWRLVCPRCRLAKCLAVGMRILGRKATSKSTSSSKPVRVKQPKCNLDQSIQSNATSFDSSNSSLSPDRPVTSSSSSPSTSRQTPVVAGTSSRRISPLITPAKPPTAASESRPITSPLSPAYQSNPNWLETSSAACQQKCNSELQKALNLSKYNTPATSSSVDFDGPSCSSVIRPTPVVPSAALSMIPTTSTATPIDADVVRCEQLLQATVAAARDLTQRYDTLPMRTTLADFSHGDVSTWHQVMKHYNDISKHVQTFANRLPRFEELPAEDRTLLFSKALSQISVSQNIRAVTPWNMNLINATNFGKHFPEFSYANEESVRLNEAISAWNPDQAEQSILMALLLYQNQPGLTDPEAVQSIASQLFSCYHTLTLQKYPNNPRAVESRLQHLVNVLELLKSTTANRLESFEQFRTQRPELLRLGRLYNRIYSSSTSSMSSIERRQQQDDANGGGDGATRQHRPSTPLTLFASQLPPPPTCNLRTIDDFLNKSDGNNKSPPPPPPPPQPQSAPSSTTANRWPPSSSTLVDR